jgi:hypothetical protein
MMKLKLVLLIHGVTITVTTASQCLKQTLTLDVNAQVQKSYASITSTNTEFPVDDTTTGFTMEYINQPGMVEYRLACEAAGGVFRAIDFDATCIEMKWKKVVGAERLMVATLPRCYGKSCTEADDQELLQEFTLKPTEERNSGGGAGEEGSFTEWTCSGTIREMSEDICHRQIDSLRENQAVEESRHAVKLSFEAKNLLNNKISSDFNNTLNYQNTCQRKGGVFRQIPVEINCALRHLSLGTVKNRVIFVAKEFPVCIGRSCVAGDAAATTQDLIAPFQEHVFQVTGMKDIKGTYEWDCVDAGKIGSGAYQLATLVGSIGLLIVHLLI